MRILKLSVKVNPDGRPSLFHLRPGNIQHATYIINIQNTIAPWCEGRQKYRAREVIVEKLLPISVVISQL